MLAIAKTKKYRIPQLSIDGNHVCFKESFTTSFNIGNQLKPINEQLKKSINSTLNLNEDNSRKKSPYRKKAISFRQNI